MTTISPIQSVVYSAVAQRASLSAPVSAADALPGVTGVQQTPDIIPAASVSSGPFVEASALYEASVGLSGLSSQFEVAQGGTQKIASTLQNLQNIAQQISADEGQGGNSAALTSLEAEFQSLYAQLNQTVNDTSFNGASLLDGSFFPDTSIINIPQDGSASGQNNPPSIIPDLGTQALFSTTPSFATSESTDAALSAISGALDLVNGVSANIENVNNQVNFAMASIETAQANNVAATSTLSEGDGLISFISELMSKPAVSSNTQTSKMSDSTLKLLNG